jgi:hypothetical protein
MKNQKRQFYALSSLILCAFLAVSLAGCGGGGGSSSSGPAYSVTGVGVIMESRLGESSGDMTINSELKRISLPVSGAVAQSNGSLQTASVSDSFLASHVAYIYLTWDAVSSADHYQVTYNGTKVWDSTDPHPADPIYSATAPEAYLDLDKELAGTITSAGQYAFQVLALSGTTVVATLPSVNVSLGRLLENYPTGISYASGSLSWTGVDNASGYRVLVFDSSNTLKADSGSTLLTTLSYSLPGSGLTSGTYYKVIVNALAVGSSGTTVEITRGVTGFTY